MTQPSHTASKWLLAVAVVIAALTALAAPSMAITGVDLSTYKRVGRFDLPEPTRTAAPSGNLLAQEASGVAYNWDTDTLFVVGDGGTSVTQVTKTGALVDTMTLPPGASDQGTEFYDTEGITYIGNNEFVMTEERYRQAVKFAYEPGGTLTRAEAKTVKLGTTIGNVGLEGLSNDPVTGGFIFAKEMEPRGVFQTQIDWNAGTATNGGPSVVNSTNLFDPALTGLVDISDVYALANVATLTGPQTDNLLIISQESGKIVNVDRAGNVASSLTLVNDVGNPLTIQQQTHEGVAMDENGVLYTVNESGGGDADHPQLWVFEPTGAPNAAPTAVALSNQTTSLPENTNTSSRLKLAEVVLTDDGIGTNTYSVTGPDAGFFEVEASGLYLKAGTVLNKSVKPSYEVTVKVEDATVSGSTPVTVPYTLAVTSSVASTDTTLAVTEVAPWGSGDGAYGADWFELTNTGTKTVNLTGWRMDDESASFGAAVTLNGVSALAPGESAIFTEDDPAGVTAAFVNHWFGGSPPAGFKIGSYTDTGTGLSTGGDQVNIFNPSGTRVTGVAFGSSTPKRSFDNTAALGSATSPVPVISTLSTAGVNGAVTVGGETGSPGSAPVKTPVIVSEVAPWGSGNPEYGADWFELTNTSPQTLDLTGWKIDDDSNSFAAGSVLNGITSLAPGESAVFVEGDAAKVTAFKASWFGGSPPASLQFGTYAGPGLGTGGDQVNIFNDVGARLTGVAFGSATTNVSFDNAAGAGSYVSAPAISTLSVDGVNGAFKIHDQIGSPGKITGPPPLPSVKVTEVSPTGSSASYGADWFELTNTGATSVTLTGWKIDDDSSAFALGSAITGVTTLAAGETAVFVEGDASKLAAFKTSWYGASVPAGLQFGSYAGPGLGNGGDQVNVFNSAGTKVTGVRFGTATTGVSFDNAAGIGSPTETPPPLISTLSVVGTNGAFTAAGGSEVGSPGTIKNAPPALPSVKVTEVSSTSSSNSTYAADFWELTNTGSTTVDLTGWKVDDDSNAFGSALALNGVSSLAAGESAIFIEGTATTANNFKTAWFGSSVPAGFQIGYYSGSGIGFSSSGDQVNVFNSVGTKVTGVRFGSGTTGVSFDNAAGVGSPTETPPPLISTLSAVGVNGAFKSVTGGETGSPGTIVQPAVAPVNTTPPSLSGAGVVGQPLTCAPGSWTGTPAPAFTYTWLRNGQIIAGASLNTYTPVTADLGKPIRCRVTATNTAAAVNAPSNTIQISVLRCTGADIAGAGSSLQGLAHTGVWAPAFAGGVCNGGSTPEVSYDPVGSAAGMAAWNHDGVSGGVDTSLAFIGTDEAPTAAQIANIEGAAGGAEVAVIPVAQTAIAILANPPAGCSIDAITNSNLAGVMEGRITSWSKFEGAEGTCNAPITRVARADESGTTAQFKNYLQRLYAKGLACTTGSTEGRASWAELANTAWPESCPEKALSPLVRPAGNGGAALVDTVNATPGSIGYAALPDAAGGKAGSTVLLSLQNNGQKKASEASFAEPAQGDVANCIAISYQVPQLKGSLGIDWSTTFGAKPAVGGSSYPLCALTYVLALSDYSAAGYTEAEQITTYDYLAAYVLQPAGQSAITGSHYAPLPTSAEALFDVLGAARKAAANIAY